MRKRTASDSKRFSQRMTWKPPGSPCKLSRKFFLSEMKQQQLLKYMILLQEKRARGIFYAWVEWDAGEMPHDTKSMPADVVGGELGDDGGWQIRRQQICHRGEAEILCLQFNQLIAKLCNPTTKRYTLNTKLYLTGYNRVSRPFSMEFSHRKVNERYIIGP